MARLIKAEGSPKIMMMLAIQQMQLGCSASMEAKMRGRGLLDSEGFIEFGILNKMDMHDRTELYNDLYADLAMEAREIVN